MFLIITEIYLFLFRTHVKYVSDFGFSNTINPLLIFEVWSDPKKLDGLNIIRLEKEFGIVPGSFLLSGI